ncbi:MAG: hypothetical protein IJD64_03725 [Clostridia bacterium]|nr:hypothetical protein [Clostridia bacterium]
MDKKLHQGHRGRMRERAKIDLKSLEDHELLEVALFYSVSRQNTNETAHRLINKFGGFRRVFDAQMDELQDVEGIGENSALFLRIISEIIARYSRDAHYITHPLTSRAQLMEYLCSLFIGESKEKIYLILLSSAGRIVHTEKIGSGFSGMSEISIKKMSALAVGKNAAAAVLAHNHPDGIAKPSAQDIATTRKIQIILEHLGVTLIDHFIVVDNECVPILHNNAPFEQEESKRKKKRK